MPLEFYWLDKSQIKNDSFHKMLFKTRVWMISPLEKPAERNIHAYSNQLRVFAKQTITEMSNLSRPCRRFCLTPTEQWWGKICLIRLQSLGWRSCEWFIWLLYHNYCDSDTVLSSGSKGPSHFHSLRQMIYLDPAECFMKEEKAIQGLSTNCFMVAHGADGN